MASNLKVKEPVQPQTKQANKDARLIAAITRVIERGQGFEERGILQKLRERFGPKSHAKVRSA